MVPLALVFRLLAGQCEEENPSPAIDWPLAARCAPPEYVQTAWALRASLAQVETLESRALDGSEAWCTTLTFASGATEACLPNGCAVADAGVMSCDEGARGVESERMKALTAAMVVGVKTTVNHGVRVQRVEGADGTTWLFTRGRVAVAIGGTCDEPVWLGGVTGFASFAITCRWSSVLAGGFGDETSVLHVVDLRREGVVDLARYAHVLGTRRVDNTRAFSGKPVAQPPTFRVDGAAIVDPHGRWCFGARGWKAC